MASTSIRKTFSSNGNRKKWTFSAWIKRTGLGSVQRLLSCDEQGNTNHDDFYQFQNDDGIVLGHYDSGYYANLTPTRKFRDTNAWYHFVITWDTAQSTASDRFKFYVNGVQETSFSTATYPSQNADSFINTTEPMEIGKRSDNDTQFLDAILTHVHFCDGYAYSPSDFGETDSTTGEWKIKTSPSVSYGTNGFFILKDGNTITDSSPNSNDWSSVSGTLTKTEDCPSNVFATLNPLWTLESSRVPTLTLGNNMFSAGGSATWYQTIATLGFNAGKFYWESKFNAGTNLGKNLIGVVSIDDMGTGTFYGQTPALFYRNEDGGEYILNNSVTTADYGTLAQNDILGFAIDMDAGTPTATFYKNGSALVSNISLTNFAGKTIVPAVSTYQSGEFQMNFGNGYFGTTAVSSAGTNASGNGIFEYDVPSGYTALSTKGLNL